MKYLYFLLLAGGLLLFMSAGPVYYRIGGTTDMKSDSTGWIRLMTGEKVIDSAWLERGKFEMEGWAPEVLFASLYTDKNHVADLFIDVEPVSVTVDSSGNSRVSGTGINDSYARFLRERDSFFDSIYGLPITDEILDQVLNRTRDLQVALYKANRGNELGAFIFARRLAYEMYDYEIERELARFPDRLQKHSYLEEARLIAEMNPGEMPDYIAGKSTEGRARHRAPNSYHPVSLPGPDGEQIHLEDIIGGGRYVLVDFWASWCGPCIYEMPVLRKAYRLYKDRGFEIFSISINREPEPWLECIDACGMEWINVRSADGWRSDVMTRYGVFGIPSCYLISPEGSIIAKDLRGDDLLEKLAEIYESDKKTMAQVK